MLTIEDEAFCQNLLLGNSIQAYRAAYSPTDIDDDTVHRNAYEQMGRDAIRQRLHELRSERASRINPKAIYADLINYVTAYGDRTPSQWAEIIDVCDSLREFAAHRYAGLREPKDEIDPKAAMRNMDWWDATKALARLYRTYVSSYANP